jgi:predicted house-cleaning NTP pyrophosphatase (Maf/HAM1 superfamily)
MRLLELTDQQVAMADIEQDNNVRQQQARMTPQQLAQAKAKEISDDRQSQDPIKRQIAQLRQKLAQLIQQDQQNNNSANPQQQQQQQPTSQAPATPGMQ